MKKAEIVLLLPEIYRRTYLNVEGNVLSALLGVMESLHAPDEGILENLDHFFDPDLLPEEKRSVFLPFLARWVDLDWLLPESGEYEADLNCLHNLILSARQLASKRGTRQGLQAFLETATGLSGFEVKEEAGRSFHFIIQCPHVPEKVRPLVVRIIAGEKPAYVQCELKF